MNSDQPNARPAPYLLYSSTPALYLWDFLTTLSGAVGSLWLSAQRLLLAGIRGTSRLEPRSGSSKASQRPLAVLFSLCDSFQEHLSVGGIALCGIGQQVFILCRTLCVAFVLCLAVAQVVPAACMVPGIVLGLHPPNFVSNFIELVFWPSGYLLRGITLC